MAEDLNLRIRLTGDGSELKAELVGAKTAVADLGAAATAAGAQVDAGLAKADAATAELAAGMAATAAAGRDLAIGAASVTGALDGVAAKALAAGDTLTGAGADARALGTSVTAAAAQINAGMAGAAAAVTGLGASFRGLSAAVGMQAAEVEALRARYVPLAAAEAAHKAALDEIARATKIGALSEAEAAAAVARTTAAYQAATARIHTMGAGLGALGGQGKLTGQQMTQLSYQLNDVVVSLAGGINPLMVLLQQGSQITPLFGGVKGTLSALAGVLTPTTVGFGLLAAGVGLGAVAFSRYITATKEVEVALAGLGRASGATVGHIQEIAEATADAAGLSVPAARAIELALVRTGKIGVEQFGALIGITKDFAATIGTDVETASAKLAEILADPAKGAETLTRQLGLIDGATARYVERLAAQGRTTEAQNALMEAMKGRLADAEAATTALGRAWEFVTNKVDGAIDAIGRFVDEAVSGPSRVNVIATLSQQLEEEQSRLASLREDPRSTEVDLIARTEAHIQALQRALRDQTLMEQEASRRAALIGQDARARATGDAALTLADSLPNNTRSGRITALSDQEAKLRRGLDAPGLSAEENARIAASISAVVHARETLLAQTDPIAEAGAAELASIRAITPEQKRRAAEEKERLALVGEVITADEAQARITAAGAAAYEQATASIGQQNHALSVNAAASLSAAQAWLTSSEAGVAAEAARAAAVTQGLSAQAALDEEIAKAALSGAQQAAQLGDQASAQARLTDAVAAGTMTSAEAGKQMQVEQALRPLLILAANAEGDEKKILTAVIERLRGAYAELNAEQERAAAVDATARQRQALGLAEYELSLTSETAEQREYLVALRQKEIELQERYGANWRSIAGEELRLYDQTLRTNAELKARTSQSDLVTGAWRRAGEQIQDSLSNSFRNALDGGSDAFENFADDTVDMMKDVAAEIASILVFRPIVGSITSTLFGGGVSQQLGLTSGSGIVPAGATGGTSSVSAGDLLGLGRMFGGGDLFGSTGMLGGLNSYLFGTAGSSAATTGAASGFLTGGGAASSGSVASPGLFGTAGATSLGAVLGSAGAGFGVSQLIASFAPGNKALSAGGGALAGAGIGFMIGGPIGAAVGGLAGLLGGLLNDKPSDKTGTGTVSDFSSTSSPEVGGLQGEKYSAENRAAATGAVDALRDAAQAAFGDYVDLSGISASISVGSRDGSRAFLSQDGQQVGEYRASSDEEGVKSIIGQSLVKIGKLYADKLPEEVRKALDVVDFSKDVDEALRLLDFAGSYRETVTALTEGIGLENEARKAARTAIEDQIDALGKFREDAETIGLTGADEAIRAFALTMVGLKDGASDVSETEAALAGLDEQFKVLAARASELGLTSAEVAAGYKKSLEAIRDAFEEDLNRAIDLASGFGIYDQVQDLLDQQAQRQKDAAALGLDSAKIARLSALEIAAATRKATDAQLAGIAEIVAASGSMAATIGLTMGRILSEIDSQIAAANQASTAARRSAEAWRAAADSVSAAIADLRGSDLSNLSPAQILAERRTALTETAAAAKAGDVDALAKLPELAKSFLDQSRAYNGDAQVYGRDFDWVQRLLDQAGTRGDQLGDQADRQADLLDRQAELLQDIADNLSAPEGPNAELLKRQQAELQRISGLLGVGNAGQEGGTASLSSLIAAVVGGNETLAGLLSTFLETTAEQQAALDAEAAAKAQAARVAAARAAYDAKVSAVGDTASNTAASVTARGSGLAKAVDDGSHLRAVSQTYDAGADSLSAVVKDTAIGSETNVPRVETLAGILADLGRQVQDIVGGALPGFKLTMRSRGVASGDSYGIRLIMYKPGGGYTTKLIDDPNGLAAAETAYLSSLDETMGGLDAASLSALRKVDFSSPAGGMKALAEAIETARNPFTPPTQALEAGGMVGNGIWGKDSVLARYAGGGTIALAGGEWVTRASQVTPATRPFLEAINDNGLDGALRTLRVGADRDARRAVEAAGRATIVQPVTVVLPPPAAAPTVQAAAGGDAGTANEIAALRRDIAGLAELLRQVVDVLAAGQAGAADDAAALRQEVHSLAREVAVSTTQVTRLAVRRGAA